MIPRGRKGDWSGMWWRVMDASEDVLDAVLGDPKGFI